MLTFHQPVRMKRGGRSCKAHLGRTWMSGNTFTHWAQSSTKSRMAKWGTEPGAIPDVETEAQWGHLAMRRGQGHMLVLLELRGGPSAPLHTHTHTHPLLSSLTGTDLDQHPLPLPPCSLGVFLTDLPVWAGPSYQWKGTRFWEVQSTGRMEKGSWGLGWEWRGQSAGSQE